MDYKNSLLALGLMKVYFHTMDNFNGRYKEIFPTINFRIRTAFFNKYIDFENMMRDSICDINGTKELDNFYNKEILEKIISLLDLFHKRVIDEMRKMTLSNLANKNCETIPDETYKLIRDIVTDVLNSPEIRYFFRMSTFHIIFEGPDRSGKSTLIKCFEKFLRQPFKSIKRLSRLTNVVVHIDELYKEEAKKFLDLSKQEDRLLFQNKLFFDVSTNIFNNMRDFKYGINILMDRSLLSNLIYANVMLDNERFIKYLFTNYELIENTIVVTSEEEKRIDEVENHFVHEIKTIEKIDNFHATIPIDFNIENILDIENNTLTSVFSPNRRETAYNRKTKRLITKMFNSSLDSYISKILYIKNTVYSYNKLDEIEKNVNQRKIIDLYSKFKGIDSLDEFYNKYINNAISEDKHDKSLEFSYKAGNDVVDCNLANCMMQTISVSFDENSNLGNNIDIIYDDDNVSKVETVFDNALNKIIEMNYQKYLNEKGPKCAEPTVITDGY